MNEFFLDDLYFLIEIFENIELFLLIIVRLVGFFVILPIFSSGNIPTVIRMAATVGFAFMIYTSGIYSSADIAIDDSIVAFTWLVVTEFLIGFTLAYVVYVILTIAYLIGQFIDDSVGFNMISMVDPSGEIQVPVMGNLLYLMLLTLLVITGGLNRILMTFFHGFQLIPLGTVAFFEQPGIPQFVISLIVSTLYLAFQIAMPIVGGTLVINMGLGLLLKSMPQMNMFVVGIPVRMTLAILMVFVMIPVFASVFGTFFYLAFDALETIIVYFMAQLVN
ncbi:MAG: flagellar biosynthetic protein FliR [Defluviitaleaceae bacterium]|nr:flagellar biosynthetic protein FliR [Defluviitaleaceae bacterium]